MFSVELGKKQVRIFVSYSNKDLKIVTIYVDALRCADNDVFLACDSISPGDKWRPTIYKKIESANKVFVFWCLHSSTSNYVEEEWRYAYKKQKAIVPILLDKTPLPKQLSEYQYKDHSKSTPNLHTIYFGPSGSDARKQATRNSALGRGRVTGSQNSALGKNWGKKTQNPRFGQLIGYNKTPQISTLQSKNLDKFRQLATRHIVEDLLPYLEA